MQVVDPWMPVAGRALDWQQMVGGLLFLMFGLRDQFFPGIVCFVVCAVAGAGTFLWASVAKTDPVKSVADYRKEAAR